MEASRTPLRATTTSAGSPSGPTAIRSGPGWTQTSSGNGAPRERGPGDEGPEAHSCTATNARRSGPRSPCNRATPARACLGPRRPTPISGNSKPSVPCGELRERVQAQLRRHRRRRAQITPTIQLVSGSHKSLTLTCQFGRGTTSGPHLTAHNETLSIPLSTNEIGKSQLAMLVSTESQRRLEVPSGGAYPCWVPPPNTVPDGRR